MIAWGREVRRLLGLTGRLRPIRDGLSGGDQALLQLLDLRLLTDEGRAADVAAGRIGAKDRAQRRLEAAMVWREVARRSGDAVALRKAAAHAEAAQSLFDHARRPALWARARAEQAHCALIGAELLGDVGLEAAAGVAFAEAREAENHGLGRALAEAGLLVIEARRQMGQEGAETARRLAARMAASIAALETLAERGAAPRLIGVEARLTRAELMGAWGARLGDTSLLALARTDAEVAAAAVDVAYEPLAWARAETLRASAWAALGALRGDLERIAGAVQDLTAALEQLPRDHSPLDWARLQAALGEALQALGEAGAGEQAFEQAVTAFDRASVVLRRLPALPLSARVAAKRAAALTRSAELTGDLAILDAAEAALKGELARGGGHRDPAGWAAAQLDLARLYRARAALSGRTAQAREAAATALIAAQEVFAEEGLTAQAELAARELESLRAGV